MNTNSTLTIERTQKGYIMRVAGRGTMRESPTVQNFVNEALSDGAEVILDLNTCDYLDSTFLGSLLKFQQQCQQIQLFSVLADNSTYERIFSVSHFDRILEFVSVLPSSTGSPVSLEISQLDEVEFGRHLMEAHRELAELGGPSAAKFQAIADQLAKELGE
jgi:anti-anti-sigma factor